MYSPKDMFSRERILFMLMPNGLQYAEAGISKHQPVKPLYRLLDVTPSILALSAKCTIHAVELNPYGIAPFKNNTNLSSRKPL